MRLVGEIFCYILIVDLSYPKLKKNGFPLCSQIQAYVFDVIRSTVPRLELDQAFESKDDIAQSVLEQLSAVMKDYGYAIVNTLVTDLAPDQKVKASMNEINAARRLKEAASHQAEADKVRQVKVRYCNILNGSCCCFISVLYSQFQTSKHGIF